MKSIIIIHRYETFREMRKDLTSFDNYLLHSNVIDILITKLPKKLRTFLIERSQITRNIQDAL